MKIHLLNHASVIVEVKDIKLLSDPWFFGTCFGDGWGLRYRNEQALEFAKDCTHLWISHFHPDHFHFPTLREIAKMNPRMTVFGNNSFNFQLDAAIQKAGFKNIIPFYERTTIKVSDSFEMTRFPATGIDNMLLIRTDEGTILNYNDCVIPDISRRMIGRKIGRVDIFMSNFNHAGKLKKFPLPADEKVKEDLRRYFKKNFLSFKPKWVIPFASYHYYRAKENLCQNNSLLEPEELVDVDKRIIPLRVGECVEFDASTESYRIVQPGGKIERNSFDIKERAESYTFSALESAAEKYCKRLNKGFMGLPFLLPSLNIKIEDLNTCVEFNPGKGLRRIENGDNSIHIIAASEALFKWFSEPYGLETFAIGSHFSISNRNVLPLVWQIVLGKLVENKIDLRSIVKMITTWNGSKFLWNRREQIIGTLISRQIGSDYQR